MAESEWLVARALRLQTRCLTFGAQDPNTNKLALFLRYQTTHERAFYKALKEFQSLREQTAKAEIGFESKRLKQSAENRASESLNLRKDQFQFQKEVFHAKKRSHSHASGARNESRRPENGRLVASNIADLPPHRSKCVWSLLTRRWIWVDISPLFALA